MGDPDDEMKLIQRLQDFSRQVRTKIEVYFDQAPPGQTRSQHFGGVWAFFISQDKTADLAIRARLSSLGGAAKNWTVVSSDHEVIREAEDHQAQVLSSQAFVGRLRNQKKLAKDTSGDKWNPSLSSSEIKYWMKRFQGDDT